jgi:ATP-dependent Clp protease protease subunit
MTLRVPKVPLNPRRRDEETIWVDVHERLNKERYIFLCGLLKNTDVGHINALLLFLDDDDDEQPILLVINSRGGTLNGALSIYDNMKSVRSDVWTLASGLAASAASLILSGGTPKNRLATKHARIMIHQPVIGRLYEPPRMLHAEAGRMYYSRNKVAEIYSQNTGKPINIIQDDMERDRYMSAAEAKDYGIIDHIVEKRKKENL